VREDRGVGLRESGRDDWRKGVLLAGGGAGGAVGAAGLSHSRIARLASSRLCAT
jgi:hypothetical protein